MYDHKRISHDDNAGSWLTPKRRHSEKQSAHLKRRLPTVVVYRGTAPAVNDVAGGHVPMMIEAILALLPMIRGGAVRAVAVTSLKRSTLAPDIPTTAEVGLPQLAFGAWWAIWGPPHMPADLVATLNGWINEAVNALAAEGSLAALGIEAAAETPEAFARVHRGRRGVQRENPQRREIRGALV